MFRGSNNEVPGVARNPSGSLNDAIPLNELLDDEDIRKPDAKPPKNHNKPDIALLTAIETVTHRDPQNLAYRTSTLEDELETRGLSFKTANYRDYIVLANTFAPMSRISSMVDRLDEYDEEFKASIANRTNREPEKLLIRYKALEIKNKLNLAEQALSKAIKLARKEIKIKGDKSRISRLQIGDLYEHRTRLLNALGHNDTAQSTALQGSIIAPAHLRLNILSGASSRKAAKDRLQHIRKRENINPQDASKFLVKVHKAFNDTHDLA